ncbi:uncharacterized protein jmjd8 [Scyliorhinus torazame]|uniref:uncharacterized protein jmjd8 n=1 Tax=Scyliorhinus torazame TaxID=75743 RepID=UPI003B59A1A9
MEPGALLAPALLAAAAGERRNPRFHFPAKKDLHFCSACHHLGTSRSWDDLPTSVTLRLNHQSPPQRGKQPVVPGDSISMCSCHNRPCGLDINKFNTERPERRERENWELQARKTDHSMQMVGKGPCNVEVRDALTYSQFVRRMFCCVFSDFTVSPQAALLLLKYFGLRWFLYPPEKTPGFHPNKTTLSWIFGTYPYLTEGDKPMECTIRPGEVLYFPDCWWHATLNIDTSVFISTILG